MAYFLDPTGFRLPDPGRFGFADDANVRVIVGTDGDDTFRFTGANGNGPVIVIGLGGADRFITSAAPAVTNNGNLADESRYYGYGPQRENALDLLGDDFQWRPERDRPTDIDAGDGDHVKFGPGGGRAFFHGRDYDEGATIFWGMPDSFYFIPDKEYAGRNFKVGRAERDPDGSGYRAELIYMEFSTGEGASFASGNQKFLIRANPNPRHGEGWEQDYVHSSDRTFDRQDMQEWLRNTNGDGADNII